LNILLTGITGLVGASVVTALLRNHPDFKIVAICRGNSAQTAQERTELTMRAQCEFDGDPASYDSIISRITVISGDVTKLPFDEIAKYGVYRTTDGMMGIYPFGLIIKDDGTDKMSYEELDHDKTYTLEELYDMSKSVIDQFIK
jgi:hypothetical protein